MVKGLGDVHAARTNVCVLELQKTHMGSVRLMAYRGKAVDTVGWTRKKASTVPIY